MDRKARERFRKSLESRHRQLRDRLLKSQGETLATQPDHGKDDADRAATSISSELEQTQKARDRALLNLVEGALKRIHDGTFGECLNCGQEVGAKRLEAIPWVRYCITCQELIDNAGG